MADANSSGARSMPIVRAAALVVVLAGLAVAKGLLIPIVLAAFLAILCYKPMRWLHEHRVPTWLALLIVIIGAVAVLGVFALIVGNAISEFIAVVPSYADDLWESASAAVNWLEDKGIEMDGLQQKLGLDDANATASQDEAAAAAAPDPSGLAITKVVSLISGALGGILSILSDFALILLVMAFMLAEGAVMPKKLRRALGNPESDLSAVTAVMEQVYSYVAIKTALSALTGLLFGIATWLIGVDFPVLWGVLAFGLNFIPNIGSVIALVPPAVLALVQLGPAEAGMVVVANLVVNQVLGNIVEPKVMGARLGLSPLVVILSLLFWAFIWGPIGMVLSVPLTMVVKIIMEHSRDWQKVAVLLGPADGGGPEPA